MPEFDKNKSYCGPNDMTLDATEPVNELCFAHDEGYGAYVREGVNPYWYYNEADELFVDQLNETKDLGFTGNIARMYFTAKKYLAPRLREDQLRTRKDRTEEGVKHLQRWREYNRAKKLARTRYKIMYPQGRKYWAQAGGEVIWKKNMPYAKRRRQRGRKRRYSKRNRNYRRGTGRSFANKVLRAISGNVYPRQTAMRINYFGVTGALTAAKTTPVPGRCTAWTSFVFKQPAAMKTLLDYNNPYDSQATMTTQTQMNIQAYVEKHTVQNACMFPVVVSVYEYYFPGDASLVAGIQSDAPSTNAIESGYYNTAVPVANIYSDLTTDPSYVPIYLLGKYNYHEGKEIPSGTFGNSDANVSFMSSSFSDTDIVVTALTRPHHMIQFKTKNMHKEIVFRKKKLVTLGPGQQFSYTYMKKNKWLDYEDIIAQTPRRVPKGAGGVMFHAVGLMSHEAVQAGATINAVNRSRFILNHEIKYYAKFQLLPSDIQGTFNSGQGINIDTSGYTTEVRAGLATTEFQAT